MSEKTIVVNEGQDDLKVPKYQKRVTVSHMAPVTQELSLAQVDQLILNERQQIESHEKQIVDSKKRIEDLSELKAEIEKYV